MRTIVFQPSVRSVFSQDGAVLMDIKGGMMYTSNPVGGRILELLQGGMTGADVVEIVSRECNTDPERVRDDLERFIEQLCSYGLVEQDRVSV